MIWFHHPLPKEITVKPPVVIVDRNVHLDSTTNVIEVTTSSSLPDGSVQQTHGQGGTETSTTDQEVAFQDAELISNFYLQAGSECSYQYANTTLFADVPFSAINFSSRDMAVQFGLDSTNGSVFVLSGPAAGQFVYYDSSPDKMFKYFFTDSPTDTTYGQKEPANCTIDNENMFTCYLGMQQGVFGLCNGALSIVSPDGDLYSYCSPAVPNITLTAIGY